jgi:hypothetical protein
MAWEGEVWRWKLPRDPTKRLKKDAMRVFESWYDHPYSILETWGDDEEPVRAYAGGMCHLQ